MFVLLVALYCSLLALNVWFFLIRPARPWPAKLGTLLQIIGVYTFAFGVINQTGILPRAIAERMTSADLFVFLQGNAFALMAGSGAMGVALDPAKTSLSAFALLELFITIGLALFALVYAAFHVLVIVPLSYLAYVLVSVPVSAIMTSATDVTFTIGNETISVKDIVSSHTVAIKNHSIAFPSIALKVTLDLIASYRGAPGVANEGAKGVPAGWLARHPRASKVVLLCGQIMLAFIVFTTAVTALVLPSLVSSGDGESSVPVGEIVGAEIVMVLIVIASVALLLKARRRWRRGGA